MCGREDVRKGGRRDLVDRRAGPKVRIGRRCGQGGDKGRRGGEIVEMGLPGVRTRVDSGVPASSVCRSRKAKVCSVRCDERGAARLRARARAKAKARARVPVPVPVPVPASPPRVSADAASGARMPVQ